MLRIIAVAYQTDDNTNRSVTVPVKPYKWINRRSRASIRINDAYYAQNFKTMPTFVMIRDRF